MPQKFFGCMSSTSTHISSRKCVSVFIKSVIIKGQREQGTKNEYTCNEAIKGRQESQLLTALLETRMCVGNVLENSFERVCVWFDGGRAGDLAFPWLLEVIGVHGTFFLLLLSSFSFTPFSLLIPSSSVLCSTFSFPLSLYHFPFLLMER